MRISEGGVTPHHDHPGGEEVYMVEGRLRIWNRTDPAGAPAPDVVLSAGEYFFAPPGETHGARAEEAVLMLVVAPGGVTRPGAAASQ
jgi:quercetin dioxygenase-like cupin family protein